MKTIKAPSKIRRTPDLIKRIGQRQASTTGEAILLAVGEIISATVTGEDLLLRQGDDEALLGHVLRRDRWGRELAMEAAGTVMDAGFELLGLHRVSAVVAPANAASTVKLNKLCFTPVSEADDRAALSSPPNGGKLRAQQFRRVTRDARHPTADDPAGQPDTYLAGRREPRPQLHELSHPPRRRCRSHRGAAQVPAPRTDV